MLGNYAANGLFVRMNNVETALDLSNRSQKGLSEELIALGLALDLEMHDLFGDQGAGVLYVFNLGGDAYGCNRIRHKKYGWHFVLEPRLMPGANFAKLSELEVIDHLKSHEDDYTDDQRSHILEVSRHIRINYEYVEQPKPAEVVSALRTLIAKIPVGSKVILAVDHDESRAFYPSKSLVKNHTVTRYTSLIKKLAREYDFVGAASIGDVIRGPDDMGDANHYTRRVYLRFSEHIVRLARKLKVKELPSEPIESDAVAEAWDRVELRQLDEFASAETVEHLFQLILQRPINNETFKSEVDLEYSVEYWIKRLIQSEEFVSSLKSRLSNDGAA